LQRSIGAPNAGYFATAQANRIRLKGRAFLCIGRLAGWRACKAAKELGKSDASQFPELRRHEL
jgi:hypothetical protein